MRKTAVSKWYQKFFDRDHSPGPPLVLWVAPIIPDRTAGNGQTKKSKGVYTQNKKNYDFRGSRSPWNYIFDEYRGKGSP